MLLLTHAKQTSVCRGFGVLKGFGFTQCGGHMGPLLQCANTGRHKEGTQRSCAIGQGQPTPAPPPSLSTGLKIDVIRFQKGKEMERSSVMTLDML